MTRSEAVRISKRLQRIADLRIASVVDWLALIEDEIRLLLPDRPQLLARFTELKEQAIQESKSSDLDHEDHIAIGSRIQTKVKQLLEGVRDMLESEPFVSDDLKDQIELIIHKGYFQSIYFRTVVGGLALVLLLVTGIEGYKLSAQVKAMQKLVEDARQQVEQSNREVAKARDDSNKRQAELALLILEGDEALVNARTKAVSQIEAEGVVAHSNIEGAEKRWSETLNSAGTEAGLRIKNEGESGARAVEAKTVMSTAAIDKTTNDNKNALAMKLKDVLTKLEAMQHPWIPRVLWSMSKTWLIGPLALIIGVLAWMNGFLMSSRIKDGPKYLIALVMAALLASNLLFLLRLN